MRNNIKIYCITILFENVIIRSPEFISFLSKKKLYTYIRLTGSFHSPYIILLSTLNIIQQTAQWCLYLKRLFPMYILITISWGFRTRIVPYFLFTRWRSRGKWVVILKSVETSMKTYTRLHAHLPTLVVKIKKKNIMFSDFS